MQPGRFAVCSVVALAAAALAGCMDASSFSQRPGFAELIAARSDQLPSPEQQALLARYKPELHLPAGHEGPLDFYRDYIAHGCLDPGDGSEPVCRVTQQLLNRHKANPQAAFTHVPGGGRPRPVAYASVQPVTVLLPAAARPEQEWLFLIYNFAFRHSGLPLGLSLLEETLANVAGSTEDWHQLDHYTAVVIALDERRQPMLAMFMQHNYMRTYIPGSDPAVGADGRVQVDVAIRSNEFYPHRLSRSEWPAASFITADTIGYLAGVDERPLFASVDVADSVERIDYELEFLRPDDAFYVFAGRLGQPRRLPGRDGPPGAMFYSLPEFVPYEKSMHLFYIKPQDRELAEFFLAAYDEQDRSGVYEAVILWQQRRLSSDLCRAGLIEGDC